VRDQGCRFPDCEAPAQWVNAHQIHHWEQGGRTDLANLAGLCATHHGVVHRAGWSLRLEPDHTLVFTTPDGTILTSPPPRRHRPPLLGLHLRPVDDLVPEPPPPPRAD